MTVPGTGPDRADAAPACDDEHHCVTCSDEGVPMRVLAPEEDGLALCTDGEGRSRTVETALVGGVAPGDELLVHAGVALARLEHRSKPPANTAARGKGGGVPRPPPRGERDRGRGG